GGLDPNVTDNHLKQVFSQYGQLVHVKIPVGKRCGFVQFAESAGYYGYGQGYETYGYAPVAQDPAMYFGGYPGYGGYLQVQQQPQPQPQPQQHKIFLMIPGYSSELMPDGHEKKRLAQTMVIPPQFLRLHSKDDELQKLLKQMECSLAMALAQEDA
ncbi:polyadenylate-binding protein RBP45, partial [Tanacetum coccineum]